MVVVSHHPMSDGHAWHMDCVGDFIHHLGAASRRIKCRTGADDFTRECMDTAADFGMGEAYATKRLDRVATFWGSPKRSK